MVERLVSACMGAEEGLLVEVIDTLASIEGTWSATTLSVDCDTSLCSRSVDEIDALVKNDRQY
jgi:hypothetical protein